MEDVLLTTWEQVVSSETAELKQDCKSRKWTERYYHEEFQN